MLYYRIDLSKVIDVAQSNNGKQFIICYYCFFNHGFKLQHFVCNGRYYLTMMCVYLRDIAIIPVKSIDYRCIIHDISKSETIHL